MSTSFEGAKSIYTERWKLERAVLEAAKLCAKRMPGGKGVSQYTPKCVRALIDAAEALVAQGG